MTEIAEIARDGMTPRLRAHLTSELPSLTVSRSAKHLHPHPRSGQRVYRYAHGSGGSSGTGSSNNSTSSSRSKRGVVRVARCVRTPSSSDMAFLSSPHPHHTHPIKYHPTHTVCRAVAACAQLLQIWQSTTFWRGACGASEVRCSSCSILSDRARCSSSCGLAPSRVRCSILSDQARCSSSCGLAPSRVRCSSGDRARCSSSWGPAPDWLTG